MSDDKKKNGNWHLLLLGLVLGSVITVGGAWFYPLDFNRAKNSVVKIGKHFDWHRTGFTAKISPIPHYMQDKMTGVTWHAQCPITLDQLVLLEVSHWDSKGLITQGTLIVNRDVAIPLRTVFEELFQLKFPIHSMRPAHEFGGEDQRSMANNNTSAFNCRTVEGSHKWSQHAYGKAIDINPLINPYIKNGVVLPPQSRPYVKRDNNVPGMIRAGSPVVEIFERSGWQWGGNWLNLKDYQHFSHNGL